MQPWSVYFFQKHLQSNWFIHRGITFILLRKSGFQKQAKKALKKTLHVYSRLFKWGYFHFQESLHACGHYICIFMTIQ